MATRHRNRTSQRKLRRLARRVLRVLMRQLRHHPELAVYRPTLEQSAREYIALYDAGLNDHRTDRRATQLGRRLLHRLMQRMRFWLGLLNRDLGDGPVTLQAAEGVPDDVMAEAERLIELAQTRGAELPYAGAMVDDLRQALSAAEQAWASAQGELAAAQQHRARVRDAAERLNADLVAFRRSLRSLLGSSHRDYQKLRVARANVSDPEDAGSEQPDNDNAAPTGDELNTAATTDGPHDAAPTDAHAPADEALAS